MNVKLHKPMEWSHAFGIANVHVCATSNNRLHFLKVGSNHSIKEFISIRKF